jgi:hypothetical protein
VDDLRAVLREICVGLENGSTSQPTKAQESAAPR